MKHKCFISFKSEDINYKTEIQENENIDMIDKSLNEPINSTNPDYIMRKIREDYLQGSTVTIALIGDKSAENTFLENQEYIKKELQASLYSKPNGILGVVLPSMYDSIYKGTYKCSTCGGTHNYVSINDSTTIKEFSYNYYLPKSDDKCSWSKDDRYCVLVKWDTFIADPNTFIDEAFAKRSEPIADKIKVYPK